LKKKSRIEIKLFGKKVQMYPASMNKTALQRKTAVWMIPYGCFFLYDKTVTNTRRTLFENKEELL
jgi:hypothetical protein